MGTRLLTILFAAAFTFVFPASSTAAPSSETEIVVRPSMPQAGDTVVVELYGTWPNVCVPSYVSHEIIGNAISINTTSPQFENPGTLCALIVLDYRISVDLGELSPGSYAVAVDGALHANIRFLVSSTRVFLPLVP